MVLNREVGDGGAKVAAQGGHGLGLGVTIFLHDLEGAAQDRAALLRLKDGDKVAEDTAALAFAFEGGQVIDQANGLPDVAELVEGALSPVGAGWLHHAGTRLALARRDYEDALRHCALVLENDAVEDRLKVFLCLEFVSPALEQNDQVAAAAFLAEGRRWAGDMNDGGITIAVCKATARLALAQTDWPAAAQQIALAGFAAHEHDRSLEVVEALRLQAALLFELGKADEAVALLEAARQMLQEQGASSLEWSLLLELGRALRVRDGPGVPDALRSRLAKLSEGVEFRSAQTD
jgi:hypothetical protein